MAKKYCFALFAIIFFTTQFSAQSRNTLEDQAYDYLNAHDYVNAYITFDKLHARYPKEIDYHFKLGICCLFYPEKKGRAIEIFKELKATNNSTEVEVYLGRAYHMNYKFDEAIEILTPLQETLMKSKRKEDRGLLEDVMTVIMNCENGRTLIKNKVVADIQNIGSPVNTYETEGVPIITADESMMLFTYVGKRSMGGRMNAEMKNDPDGMYLSDIFISYKDTAGAWGKPQPLTALNTKGNDAAIAISPDGSQVFTFFSNNQNEGDIQVSNLDGRNFSPPVSLNANINTPEYWEGSCSISADGRFLYFSSERPTGLGGRDLYVSEWTDGDWGPAVSLGENINTTYDEDAPFIHPDGVTLFFSSKGHTSIGGYDIMFSVKEGDQWTKPKSMGIPLNTVEDDSYYVINSKGDKGYFSSTRDAAGAKGEQDIYMVTPGILGDRPVVALLKGTVFGDDKPVGAKLEIVRTSGQVKLGPYYSNKESGKYLTALSPGHVYKITITADGYETLEEEFDIERLATFMEKPKDFYLYSSEAAKMASVVDPAKKTALKESMALAVNTTENEKEPVKEEPKTEEVVAVVEEVKENLTNQFEETPVETKTMTPEETQAVEPEKTETEEPVLTLKETTKEEPIAKAEPKKEKKTKVSKPVKEEESTSEEKVVMSPCSGSLPDLEQLKGRSLNETDKYRLLMDLMGEYCADGLVFTVQIGAYKKPQNYKYKNLKDLGKVSSANYPDGLTRFTQKQFNTLKDAEKQRQKAISRGQKDAWIVAFLNGKRYTLEDLIMIDFMGKPIN